MTFEQWAATLVYQPMDTLPWEFNTVFDPPRKYMPLGVVLKSVPGQYCKFVLVGNDIAGEDTKGCSCCSVGWVYKVDDFVGWAWAFPMEVK